MKKLIFTAILFAISLVTVNAQEIEPIEAIKEQLSDIEVSQLSDAEAQKSKADKIMEGCATKQAAADKLKTQAASQKKGKAKKLLKQAEDIETPLIAQKINAYNLYEKYLSTTYGIYAANLKELLSSANDEKRQAANVSIKEATNNWTKADQKLKTVPTGKKADQKQILKTKEQVNQSQNDAIAMQIQAYGTLLGWYDKKEPVKAVQEEDIFVEEKPVKKDKITFKIQIAAERQPLTLEQLDKIYPTKEIINNELSNGVYRYTFGYYSSYEEAHEVLLEVRKTVKDAFITAYRNGVRIEDINEGINQ